MSLIRNTNEVVKAIDFTGVQNKLIHPSDIDAVLEFDNRILILIEVKQMGAPIPTGQRILLERLCDNWNTYSSVVLKVEYLPEQSDATRIPLDVCVVTEFYYQSRWQKLKNPIALVRFINHLGETWKCEKCKF